MIAWGPLVEKLLLGPGSMQTFYNEVATNYLLKQDNDLFVRGGSIDPAILDHLIISPPSSH